jgi:hypothetical protein
MTGEIEYDHEIHGAILSEMPRLYSPGLRPSINTARERNRLRAHRKVRLPKCNGIGSRPGRIEPEVWFRVVHVALHGNGGSGDSCSYGSPALRSPWIVRSRSAGFL